MAAQGVTPHERGKGEGGGQLVQLHLAILWGDPRQTVHNVGKNDACTHLDQKTFSEFIGNAEPGNVQTLSWNPSCKWVKEMGPEPPL